MIRDLKNVSLISNDCLGGVVTKEQFHTGNTSFAVGVVIYPETYLEILSNFQRINFNNYKLEIDNWESRRKYLLDKVKSWKWTIDDKYVIWDIHEDIDSQYEKVEQKYLRRISRMQQNTKRIWLINNTFGFESINNDYRFNFPTKTVVIRRSTRPSDLILQYDFKTIIRYFSFLTDSNDYVIRIVNN